MAGSAIHDRAEPHRSGGGCAWEDAHWYDEVLWARDRQTSNFLALVCVHFDANPFDPLASDRLATAVFEYRKRKWSTRANGWTKSVLRRSLGGTDVTSPS